MSFLTRLERPPKPPPRRETEVVPMANGMEVDAYYRRPDGAYELARMYRIDYDEARARDPHSWSRSRPAGKIIDRRTLEQRMRDDDDVFQ